MRKGRLAARPITYTFVGLVVALFMVSSLSVVPSTAAYSPTGELDCNGDSPAQTSLRSTMLCTDIRGFPFDNQNNWGGRFYDNGYYIGHDEPDMTFVSNQKGTGNDVTWTETLGIDPAALPTATSPGSDVAHFFELTSAPWFSMALCDGSSYPQLPCSPNNNANAPKCTLTCTGQFPGGGSALMELQFYPPGFGPFAAALSCNNTRWCAALNIDSLECTWGFYACNNSCIEPVNFAFIQRNGVPTGRPSPQGSNVDTFTPNAYTLMMNPGDTITVHLFDAPAPAVPGAGIGPGYAFEAVVDDLTTHQSGFMQASAYNGFAQTSMVDCSGSLYNFEPEYSSAAQGNIVPWTALQTDISTEFEIGHFTACTSVSGSLSINYGYVTDTAQTSCSGPYEDSAPSEGPETSDALCYPSGDTHGGFYSAPDEVSGCLDNYYQNGDLDFDGSPYWAEWPTSATATASLPGSFVQSLPTSRGLSYPYFFIQTDLALSESTCNGNTGCSAPPPNAPGGFYPYWSFVKQGKTCAIEFGNVASGTGVYNMGKDRQYGTNRAGSLGYPEIEGVLQRTSSC